MVQLSDGCCVIVYMYNIFLLFEFKKVGISVNLIGYAIIN